MDGSNGKKPRFESAEPLPDRAGTDPDRDDQLGYASFSKNLAQAIARITPTDGLVIALYGRWGAGESTVLNFVESYISRENGSGVPTVVRFNPWWFADRDDLIRTSSISCWRSWRDTLSSDRPAQRCASSILLCMF